MQLVTFALLPAAVLAVEAAADAGGPQSPPTYTDTSTTPAGYPTTTYPTTTPSYPTSPQSYPTSPQSYPTSPQSYPTSSYSINPGGPMNGTTYPTSPAGNLSTTGGQQPSTSVVVTVVTGAGGQASTQTSLMVVTPSGAGPAPSAQGSSAPQSGDGFRVQGGAVAAMAIFGGFLAFML